MHGLPDPVQEELGTIRLRTHAAVAGFIFMVPKSLFLRYVTERRLKVRYVGSDRINDPSGHGSKYKQQIVAAIRELETQAVEERKYEVQRQKNVALV